jgi:hypothetical protein
MAATAGVAVAEGAGGAALGLAGTGIFGKRSFLDGFTKTVNVPGSSTEVENPH